MEQHNPSKQDLDFLAELDAAFGKKSKAKALPDRHAARRALNNLFHLQNPTIQTTTTKLPEVDLHYDWAAAKLGQEQPIRPEARISTIVHQTCDTCQETSWYTGNEYIRFGRRRLRYKILGAGEVETESTILRRIGDCDPNLVAFGPPEGHPLPVVIEEHQERVPRCPACIMLERHCVDLFLDDAKRKASQPELNEPEAKPLELPELK